MSLFMVLYAATGVGGTWGPLPYDMTECLTRKAAVEQEIKEKAPKDSEMLSWRFECEMHAVRPPLGSK